MGWFLEIIINDRCNCPSQLLNLGQCVDFYDQIAQLKLCSVIPIDIEQVVKRVSGLISREIKIVEDNFLLGAMGRMAYVKPQEDLVGYFKIMMLPAVNGDLLLRRTTIAHELAHIINDWCFSSSEEPKENWLLFHFSGYEREKYQLYEDTIEMIAWCILCPHQLLEAQIKNLYRFWGQPSLFQYAPDGEAGRDLASGKRLLVPAADQAIEEFVIDNLAERFLVDREFFVAGLTKLFPNQDFEEILSYFYWL